MVRRSPSRHIRATRTTSWRRELLHFKGSPLLAAVPIVLCGVSVSAAGASAHSPSGPIDRAPRAHASSAPAFCSRLSAAKIGSIVGGSVTLAQTSAKGKIIACIFSGSGGTTSIETQTGLPATATATLSGAEKAATANFPAGLKITFDAVPSIGPTAYSWSAKIGGAPYVGLNTHQGSVGYDVEMQGALRLSVLEKLVKLEIASK